MLRRAGHTARVEKWEIHAEFQSENVEGSDNLGDVSVDGRIILKLILKL
jgi:hypothetical protein